MAKELRCGDIMPGCPTVLEGKDEKEVMAKAAESSWRRAARRCRTGPFPLR